MATAQELLAKAKATQTSTRTGSAFGGGSLSTGSLSNASLGGANTKTSEGLYQLAVQNGLQNEANSLLARQSGENVNKIFSGGFISDIFDVLNTLQYGVTGVLKGKSFSEGVRTRQSFSDKDALGDNGIPGVIGGILLDIAVDPLTYVAPATIVKKVPLLSRAWKAAKKVTIGEKAFKGVDTGKLYKSAEEALRNGEKAERLVEGLSGGSKVGNYLVDKLAYYTGKDPVYLNTYERSIRNIGVTFKRTVDLGKVIAKLDPAITKQMIKLGDDGRFVRVPLQTLAKTLPGDAFKATSELYKTLDDLGKQAVDLGLISKAKYEENIGEYIKAAYNEFELAKNKIPFGYNPQTVKGVKKRVEVLSEARKADRIDNPAYLLMKSIIDLTRDVENAKMFREINKRFGRDTIMEGFEQMPTSKGYGELAGKFVPKYMADNLRLVIQPPATTFDKIEAKLVGNFKYAKVVLNPATHARNIASNRILNYWKLGMNPLDPRTWKAEAKAIKEIARKGGKYTAEATPLGYNLDSFAAAELKGILESPEMLTAMGKYGNKWDSVKKTIGDIYQGEENQAKLAAYIYNREVKNLNPEEAWKAAVSATFDYAAVTPLIRKLRSSIFGLPFITFTYKATPLAIETALKNPERISVIGKIKNSIENAADIEMTERERASEPPWVKDGFYVKLPGKDAEGRSRYFDLTYILPFGDLVSGNFWERGMNMETGTPESTAQATIRKSPFLQLVGELAKNKDFYGNNIWLDSDSVESQNLDILRHISKTFLPPMVADQIPGGYNEKGEQAQRGIKGALSPQERMDQQRTLSQELARNLGFKVQPINVDIQETYSEWNKKKALETLLKERGIISEFSSTYVPKPETEL